MRTRTGSLNLCDLKKKEMAQTKITDWLAKQFDLKRKQLRINTDFVLCVNLCLSVAALERIGLVGLVEHWLGFGAHGTAQQ